MQAHSHHVTPPTWAHPQIESDRGGQKFAWQGRDRGMEGGGRNLLSHHDWSHDDRSATATIAVLYRTHTHTQVWEMRARPMRHTKHLIERCWRCSSVELCALRTDLIFCTSTLPLCWLLIHTAASPSFCPLVNTSMQTHIHHIICHSPLLNIHSFV